ncbi:hypothetical protein AB9P05_16175 [Roseivirga sp. BDSF3-8]|uniref:hypothetical protein n=1 Tax=Roseivirga sp. BDSF3-8 TaxID=3241598 RepID=UPI0035320041
MAIIENNPWIEGARGMVRGAVVYRQLNGKTVVSSRPKRSCKPRTDKQIAYKERFRAASVYGNRVKECPALSEVYRVGVKPGVGVYSVALKDYIKAPVIEDVLVINFNGRAGETLGIYAYDDFAITSLRVTLLDANGDRIEGGEGRVVVENALYEYELVTNLATDAPTYIRITARDRPGNATVMVKAWLGGEKKLVDAELPVMTEPEKEAGEAPHLREAEDRKIPATRGTKEKGGRTVKPVVNPYRVMDRGG